MKKVAAIVLSLLTFSFAVPVARVAADEPQIVMINEDPENLKFAGDFFQALMKELQKETPLESWVVLLDPVLSPRGKAQIEIRVIRVSNGPLARPIIVGILNEDADTTLIRVAAKSTRNVIVKKATEF